VFRRDAEKRAERAQRREERQQAPQDGRQARRDRRRAMRVLELALSLLSVPAVRYGLTLLLGAVLGDQCGPLAASAVVEVAPIVAEHLDQVPDDDTSPPGEEPGTTPAE